MRARAGEVLSSTGVFAPLWQSAAALPPSGRRGFRLQADAKHVFNADQNL